MLKDTKAVVLLTEESLIESFTAEGVQVIDMDRVNEKISSYGIENLPNLSNSEALALCNLYFRVYWDSKRGGGSSSWNCPSVIWG